MARRTHRASRPSSVLGPGVRRRGRPWLAALAVLPALAAVAGASYLWLSEDDTRRIGTLGAEAVARSPAADRAAPASRSAGAAAVSLAGVDAFHAGLRKPPRAGLVFALRDGDVLWRLRPRRVLAIASLTKIMTAVLVTERAGAGERVRITHAALRYQGSGVGLLPRGRRVSLEALLNGLLLVSGNDAAIALAGHVAGDERSFVRLMNARARALGLRCTRFVSSHGLEDGNRSCARDLAVLTRIAMRRMRIRGITRRHEAALRFPIRGGRLFLSGHNPLLRSGYRGAIGLKTGYTDAAGRCFVGVARRDGRTLGVVLLDSPDPGKQAARLLDKGFRAAWP